MYINTLIIGGGSAGLYLATLLEKVNVSYKIIESFNKVGGQCVTTYPYKHMYDVPGLGAITGQDYINKLLSYINPDNIIKDTAYLTHEKKEDHWVTYTSNGNCYNSLNLVFATGVGMGGYQKPKVDKLELYENKQIFFFPQCPELYVNKKIVVFGGGDSTFDALEELHQLTGSLSLVHRRTTFTAMKNKEKILEKVQTYTPYNLVRLNGGENLESVTIEKNKIETTLEADYIFFCYGYNTTGNLKFKVNMNNMMDDTGVFAIGAASDYTLKRDLITTGLWEAKIVFSHLI